MFQTIQGMLELILGVVMVTRGRNKQNKDFFERVIKGVKIYAKFKRITGVKLMTVIAVTVIPGWRIKIRGRIFFFDKVVETSYSTK